MAHKFNPGESWKLDNPERRKMMPPEETLIRLGLDSGDVFVDIGCGIGYFTLPALDIVGGDGRVYGIDTSETMLDKLKSRIGDEMPDNLVLIRSGEYSPGIAAKTADFVFLSNVLHEVDDPGLFIDRLKEILVENGKLAVIDWIKKESDFGPPEEHRLEQEYVRQLMNERQIAVDKSYSIGGEFYAVVGIREADRN